MLGFFAGWHHDFDTEQAGILNRMVMLYALPMTLFAGIMGMPKSQLFSNMPMFFWLFLGMAGSYIIVFALSYFLFKRPLGTAALQALAIAGPAVPFVGVSVLGMLFGSQSALAIAMCGLIMNLVQVPLTLILLSYAANKSNAKTSVSLFGQIVGNSITAAKEPVVWAPLLGFVLVLLGLHAPKPLNDSLELLGKATGGVALFASGIVLFAQKVGFSSAIFINIVGKNLILPALAWLAMHYAGTAPTIASISLLCLAIPTASISIILAVQFKTAEREIASTLFLSTLASVASMGLFIWIANV